MADNLVFEESLNTEIDTSEFISKKYVYVNDNNNGNYTSQVVIDSTPLSNAGGWINWSEAFIVMPLVVQLTNLTSAGRLPAGSPITNYSWAFKNGFWQMINSMTVEFNNQNIVQQTPFLNVFRSFKCMTSWSKDDLENHGSTCGFYPDSANSWSYSNVAGVATTPTTFTANGSSQGVCNNRDAVPSLVKKANATGVNIPSFGDTDVAGSLTVGATSLTYAGAGAPNYNSGDEAEQYNKGLRMRQSWINYDAVDGADYSNGQSLLNTVDSCNAVYRSSKVQSSATGGHAWNIYAKLRLKDLADFFEKCPLLKGSTMRFYINTNQTLVNFSVLRPVIDGNGAITNNPVLTVSGVNTVGGLTNPLMVASADLGQGSAPLYACSDAGVADTLQLSVSIFRNNFNQANVGTERAQSALTACRLYAPVYTMNPIAESKYLSLAPTKRIKYNDIFQYQFNAVGRGDSFNFLVSNGINNIQSVLVIPFISKDQSAYTVGATTYPAISYNTSSVASPCSTAPATPDPITLSNFNILISGVNLFLNNENYDFEAFCQQLAQSNQLNGGLTTGLASGLISESMFSKLYRYYYGNCSRILPSEEGVSRSVQIVGQNKSSSIIDLMVFVEFQKEIVIDVATGARIE